MTQSDELQDLATSDEQTGVLDEAEELSPSDAQTIRYDITSYGADYPVDGLIQRLQRGDVYIPQFQREFVWSKREASRFVESLLLGLPVPGIFLSRDSEGRLLVVDGQQRLSSLRAYYSNDFRGGPFRLEDVDPLFDGKRYSDLESNDRRILDDSIIHSTIVQQNEPTDDNSGIYSIFERLNNGGRKLYPQEIRASIYGGRLNSLLSELNRLDAWRAVYGPQSVRLKDVELILRFLALRFNAEEYSKPMKSFLNRFMERNRNVDDASSDRYSVDFSSTINEIYDSVGPRAFKPTKAFNAAVFDAVAVATSRRIASGGTIDRASFRAAYDSLLVDREFLRATSRATSDEQSVRERLDIATAALATV